MGKKYISVIWLFSFVLISLSTSSTVFARKKKVDIIKLLIAGKNDKKIFQKVKKALAGNRNLETKDHYGNTLLFYAVRDNHFEIVKYLIQKKANVNALNKENETPVFYAAANQRTKIIRYLLSKKAKVNIKNTRGLDVLNYYIKMILTSRQHLVDKLSIKENLGVIDSFIAHGADVNTKDNNHTTPLHRAAGGYANYIAKHLLAKGANPNAVDLLNNHTPLHLAFPNIEMAKILIEGGADINAQSDVGKSPIFSYYTHKPETKAWAKFFIAKGAELNLQVRKQTTHTGNTLLHYYGAEPEMVKLLVKNKADPRIKNKQKRSPLFAAVTNLESLKYFKSLGLKIYEMDKGMNTLLHEVARKKIWDIPENYKRNIAIVKFLLKNKVSINFRNRKFQSVLHIAVQYAKNKKLIDFLISKGVSINSRDVKGNTPLHYSLMYAQNNIAIAKVLIKAGADVTMKNEAGQTPKDLRLKQATKRKLGWK